MRRVRTVGVIAAVMMGLAGCGGGSETSGLNLPEYQGSTPPPDAAAGKSAEELLSGAQQALAEAEGVTVFGETRSATRVLGGSISFNGDAGSGVFTFGGGTVDLLYADGKAWYKGDSEVYAAFGVAPEAITRRIGEKWIVVDSVNPRLKPLDLPAGRDEFLSAVVDPGTPVTAGEVTEIDGVDATALTGSAGTLYVATATLLPLRFVLAGAEDEGIDLTYDDEVAAPAPLTADQFVDLADLK